MIQRGALRAGVAKMVSGSFGEDSTAGAFVGAFTGVVASAVIFPIAWAIGDAIMNIPGIIDSNVTGYRANIAAGERAGGGLVGKEWLERAGAAQEVFGGVKDALGEVRVSEDVMPMMRAWQAAGQDTNRPGEAERAAVMIGAISTIDNEVAQKKAYYAEQMKFLRYGTEDEQKQAAEAFQSIPRVNEIMQERYAQKAYGKGMEEIPPIQRALVADAVKAIRQIPFGQQGGYNADYIESVVQEYAEDERIKNDIRYQRTQWRIAGERGWERAKPWNPTNLREYEEDFFESTQGIREIRQKAKEQYYFVRDEETEQTWADKKARAVASGKKLPGNKTAEEYFGGTFEEYQKKVKAESIETVKRMDRFQMDKTTKFVVQQRIAEKRQEGESVEDYEKRLAIRREDLIQQAKVRAGEEPFGGKRPTPETPDYIPSKYQWTSFSGLADQMQMMWSGAPPDTGKFKQDDLDQAMNGPPAEAMDAAAAKFDAAADKIALAAEKIINDRGAGETLGDPVPMIPVS